MKTERTVKGFMCENNDTGDRSAQVIMARALIREAESWMLPTRERAEQAWGDVCETTITIIVEDAT